MYGIYPEYQYTEEDIEDDPESYSGNIEGYWEYYDSEKHDGHSMTGIPEWKQA